LPATAVPFVKKQVGVAFGMAAALAITVAVFMAPDPRQINIDRTTLWVACSGATAFWLLIAVALMARHRFFSSDDIDGAGLTNASAPAKVLQSLIQNTLEQTVLAISAYGAWLFLGPASSSGVIVYCACLFSIGRLLFFVTYARGAAARALGFGLTFYPTVGVFMLTLPRLLSMIVSVMQAR
jgi:hypothetical protein